MGRAITLRNHEATQINRWVKTYPRLVDLLGRWGAKNLDGQLNSVDYKITLAKVAIERAKKNCQTDIHTQTAVLVPEFTPIPEQGWGWVGKRPNDGYTLSVVRPKLERIKELLARRAKP